MSDLADVLCSEMKRIYDVNLSFDGDLVSFRTAHTYHPGEKFNNLDLSLSLQEIGNENRYYLVWQDEKKYCLHVATVFSDNGEYNGVLEASLLHIKNLHASVENTTLPGVMADHIDIRHFDLLTSSKRIPVLGAKFIGGSIQDKQRTIKSFIL